MSLDSVDERTIDLLRRGSPAAVELLYARYGGLLYTLALRVLGDEEAAEQVVQETLVSIWRQAPAGLPASAGLRTWLCTAVRNRAIGALPGRGAGWRPEVLLDVLAGDGGADPPDAVAAVPDREQVGRALAALPGDQRRALELSYYAGCSLRDISEMTGEPLDAVRGTTRTALRSLGAALGPPAGVRPAG